MNRSRVPRWTPTFWQALRLAARPAIVYFVFTVGGFAALIATVLWYNGLGDLLAIMLLSVAGVMGILAGMLVAVLRARLLPVFVAGGISVTVAVILLAFAPVGGKEAILAVACFCMAFPCGMLSLQHRYELLASFWPAVGWIGGVFAIINKEGRLHQWESDKVTAWLPVPLFYLACFLLLWLLYLSSKQAMRVELWQSLSGAIARRVTKKAAVGAIPRRNVLPMLFAALVLFGVVAALSPYLWRTGKGEHDGKNQHGQVESDGHDKPKPSDQGPKMDGEAIAQQMKELAEAAKSTALHLWPLLLLLLLYRPAKRALLSTHLLTPVFPSPPTERIDNHWEYVRIAAEDAGVVPAPSDSVEQLLARIRDKRLGGPALARAAEIYARTRYGFTVGRGDPQAMRQHAIDAGKELRAHLGPWDVVKNMFRRLS
ncbi:MAG TPA: hypothetical protein VLT33_26530 [Labilithrix sp.]|nr:hypothetical protein [Labilithrix sp.]